MRRYETIVIIDPNLGEAQVKDEQKKLEDLLKNNSAVNISVDKWGKKEIAFYVGKHRFGTYLCFRYESDNHDVVGAVGAILRITESVIRFQSHRLDLKPRKFKGNPRRKPVGDLDEFYDDSDVLDAEYA